MKYARLWVMSLLVAAMPMMGEIVKAVDVARCYGATARIGGPSIRVPES